MDVIEKLEEFLKTKDEEYLLKLKNHFIERFQITTNDNDNDNDNGKWSIIETKVMSEVQTKEFLTDCFAEVPGGFADFLYLLDEFIEPISEIVFHFLSENFVSQFDSAFFEKFKYELDLGSDEGLLVLVKSAFKKAEKHGFSSTTEQLQATQNFIVNFNGNILKLLMQAVLSIHLELFGSAKMQIQHLLKIILKKLTTYSLQHAVVEKSAVKKNARLAAKKGSAERWKLERKVKIEAFIMLKEMKESGKFKNNSQASKELTESLCKYSKQIGSPFTDFFSAQRRIYDWFREGQ
jgi:hypothetical protein